MFRLRRGINYRWAGIETGNNLPFTDVSNPCISSPRSARIYRKHSSLNPWLQNLYLQSISVDRPRRHHQLLRPWPKVHNSCRISICTTVFLVAETWRRLWHHRSISFSTQRLTRRLTRSKSICRHHVEDKSDSWHYRRGKRKLNARRSIPRARNSW